MVFGGLTFTAGMTARAASIAGEAFYL
jgi:hypothetical protein